ncbi:30S ribosome-binding factor RbfA [Actinomyces vulturis]|uniref:30S ribosome-binding factor RbfA n=1 Tax=Actinomyces vulturis TaxID=1857645 RepID=UPI0008301321|nr:30S ribosome-binding factor RbfA [Actinomyces vulturis]
MADQARARKVADRIHETVARLLEGRIKDPRLGFVTVTDVRVTGDLQQATVFYTVLGDEKARRNSAAALRSANGLIRSEVGKALGIRLTPSLTFVPDALPEAAKTLDDALAIARAKDEKIARLAAQATPVAGEDPYRRRDDEVITPDSADSPWSAESADDFSADSPMSADSADDAEDAPSALSAE